MLATSSVVYPQTGLFLVIEKGDCAHIAMSLDSSQQFCIPEEPIINKTEFKTEGVLQQEALSQNQYFNLQLSNRGFEKFKLIYEHLAEKELVFVVDGKAVGTLQDSQPRKVIQIIDRAGSKKLEPILEALCKMPMG
jgi:hypothetical protein